MTREQRKAQIIDAAIALFGENNRMWSQMRRSPLFDFLDRGSDSVRLRGCFALTPPVS